MLKINPEVLPLELHPVVYHCSSLYRTASDNGWITNGAPVTHPSVSPQLLITDWHVTESKLQLTGALVREYAPNGCVKVHHWICLRHLHCMKTKLVAAAHYSLL